MQIIILRTHFYSEHWHSYLKQLEEKFKVIIVADIEKNYFHYNGFEHIYLNGSTCSALSLTTKGHYKWRCGDYAYYLVYDKYKFDYAWLVEADVFFSFKSLADFFDQYSLDNSDFLCTYYKKADKDWYWFDKIQGYETIYSCLMPLTRIKREVVEELHQRRVAERGVANDEVFLATTISSIGKVQDLNAIIDGKRLYDNLSFCYRVLKPLSYLIFKYKFSRESKTIYHPVVSWNVYCKKNLSPDYIRGFEKTFYARIFKGDRSTLF